MRSNEKTTNYTAPRFAFASANMPYFQARQNDRVLGSLVMAQVRYLLGYTTTRFLSSDVALNLFPFNALVNESGAYLT